MTLNFVSADIRDVARSVLGDMLGLNFEFDAAIQGTMTLETNRPIAKRDVLPAFENALRLNGLGLVDANGTFRIVPAAGAARAGSRLLPSPDGVGFGVRIIALKYVSASDVQAAIEPLVAPGAIIRVDSQRNIITVGGTEDELRDVEEKISIFDVDYLAGVSFALFQLKNSTAKAVATELGKILAAQAGPANSLIKLVPLERLNAVLVTSLQQKYLTNIASWIERLDQDSGTAEKKIYVYAVQNGRAEDLSRVLSKIIGVNDRGVGRQETGIESQPLPGGQGAAGFTLGAATPTSGQFANNSFSDASEDQNAAAKTGAYGAAGAGAGGASSNGTGDGGMRITADEVNNALLIYATPQQYGVIRAALEHLDLVPMQVLIEAVVAEVTLTKDLKYGVQYFLRSGNHSATLATSTDGSVAAQFPGFNYVFSGGKNIQLVLHMLEGVTTVNVVSAPEMLVRSNQTARLQVGDQVPIATASAVSVQNSGAPVVNSIQLQDTGVILKVTPRVNDGGLVLMDVSQEVSSVSTTTTSTLDSPTISQRRFASSIAVQDGQTIALGGLISDSKNHGDSGIPFLKDIPVLGNLFSTTNVTDARTEILVLITPHVVRNAQGANDVTAELRRKLPLTAPSLPLSE